MPVVSSEAALDSHLDLHLARKVNILLRCVGRREFWALRPTTADVGGVSANAYLLGSLDAQPPSGKAVPRSAHRKPDFELVRLVAEALRISAVADDAQPEGAGSAMPVFPGREFALEELHIQELIATDTVGVVVHGRVLGVDVAVKAVQIATDPEGVLDLRRELDVYRSRLQPVQGMCIPRLVAYGTTCKGTVAFIATELVMGAPLEPARMEEEAVQQLLEAVDAVHACGVYHGDLEARNIFQEQDTGRIVILDFSFSDPDAKAWELAAERGIVERRVRGLMAAAHQEHPAPLPATVQAHG
ncbi:hypothetical protein WJX72_005749 [[Myrmecia] bisecta]|uniref:Protein kinase domain-containing protein n=1 Tax=[Myrmecia] bisecta TaxID=41462 RepID=A0AAW1QQY0_9CHLO